MPSLLEYLDQRCDGMKPSKIITGTLAITTGIHVLYYLLAPGEVLSRGKKAIFRYIRLAIDRFVQSEIRSALKDITFPTGEHEKFFTEIPEEGLSDKVIRDLSNNLHKELDQHFEDHRISGVVYRGNDCNTDLVADVVKTHLWSNPLFADYFGATRKIEAEVVNMMLGLFHASNPKNEDGPTGTYTFGGTESILLAMLAYRNWGKSQGIAEPEVVLCRTAHPAFDKASEYFGIRLVKVDCDPKTTRVLVDEMEKNINKNTVAIVGSAPQFATGTVDNLAALSDLALKYDVGLHCDACLGGFIVQFMGAAGHKDFVIDFRLAGITTISCDIHKWGGAPKGASICMFRHKSLRKHSTFAFADYPGGLYVTAGLSGSKPGYAIAAAWATILNMGRKSYIKAAKDAVNAGAQLGEAIKKIPHLHLIGIPETTVVAFSSDTIDIYRLQKIMKEKDWVFNALQFPPAIHLGITLEHTHPGVMNALIEDLKYCVKLLADEVEEDRKAGKVKVQRHDAIIYGSTQGVPIRSIIQDVLRAYVDKYYVNAKMEGAK